MSDDIEVCQPAVGEVDEACLEIRKMLYCLGITQNYKGFDQMVFAIELCRKEPERLLLVTKWVYPDVARKYHTSWQAVERNIRTVNRIIWRENRPLLEHLAHRPLARKPCAGQLLAILSAALLSGSPNQADEKAQNP